MIGWSDDAVELLVPGQPASLDFSRQGPVLLAAA